MMPLVTIHAPEIHSLQYWTVFIQGLTGNNARSAPSLQPNTISVPHSSETSHSQRQNMQLLKKEKKIKLDCRIL
jgi:hypothetical protein